MFELADYVQAFSYNGIVRKLEVFRPASGGSKEDRDFVLLEDVGDHFDITGVHFVREDGVFLSFTRDSRLRRHVPERIPACRGSTIHIIPNTSKEQSTAAIYSSPPPSSSSLSSSSSSSSTVTTTQHAAALSNSEPAFVDVSAISWQPKCQTSSNNSSRKNPHGSMPLSYLQAACLDSSTSTDDSIAGNGHDAGPEGKEEHDAEISGSNHSDYASSRYSRSSSRSDSVSSGLASPASINTNLPDWVYTFHRQQPKERYEDGRTRHMVDSAPYMLPNDLSESDRLEAQHYIVRYCFQGNYNVRLDHDATKLKILDVATGTGVWALEMAHEFPMADIYGVDISPLYPIPETSSKEVPPNCHFQLCNVLDGLPFPDNYFDFVYQRLLVYAFTQAQRKQVNAELLRVLKPSGHVQLIESDGLIYNAGPTTEMVNNLSLETPRKKSVEPTDVQNLKPGLRQAGFTQVHSFCIALPVGDWGGLLGDLSRQNMHGLASIWIRGELGRQTQEECEATLAEMDKECEQFRSFYKAWLVIGQKPNLPRPPMKGVLPPRPSAK